VDESRAFEDINFERVFRTVFLVYTEIQLSVITFACYIYPFRSSKGGKKEQKSMLSQKPCRITEQRLLLIVRVQRNEHEGREISEMEILLGT